MAAEGEITYVQEDNDPPSVILGSVLVAAVAAVTQEADSVSSSGTVSVSASAAVTQEGDSTSSTGIVLVSGDLTYTEGGGDSGVQDIVLTAYETINFMGTLGSPYRFLLPEYTALPDPTGVRNIGDVDVSLTMVAQSGEKLWQPKKGAVAAAEYDYINYTLRPGEDLLFIPLTTRGWLKYPGDPFGMSSPATIGFLIQSATGDGTTTVDWRHGNKFNFQFGAFNETFTFTDPDEPCNLILKLTQDSVGSRTVTWPASVKWPGGVAPTLTTTATTGVDIISLYFDGTNYYGSVLFDLG